MTINDRSFSQPAHGSAARPQTINKRKNNKLVIDEWVVDQLLLKDSLYSYLLPMITDDDFEDFTIEKVSSRDFIRQVDSTYSLEASNESIVLAKLLVDSDNSWIQSASFEIRELYAVPFDALSFVKLFRWARSRR